MTDRSLRLLMVAPAPVIPVPDGMTLDAKFVEGMRLQSDLWPGQFDCILRRGARSIPFGARVINPAQETFGLHVLEEDERLTQAHFEGYDLVMCSADDDRNLGLAPLVQAAGARLVVTLEYTLETRLKILFLTPGRSLPRRCISALRLMARELRRRRFMASAQGLQANGYPAHSLCRKSDPDALLYLDNRMSPGLFATKTEMDARCDRLLSAAPVRLVYTGRLEPMKGAQDLIPVARALSQRGVTYSLDIFGAGQLRDEIANQIEAGGLAPQVRLHEPLDFETELVPHLRQNADIFLCCHKQSDPSCTYIENMGCGLAVIGYENRMWSALAGASIAGWTSPAGRPQELADAVAQAAGNRVQLAERCRNALAFAQAHDFRAESRKRMEHLAKVAEG
ncbi:glycosyltransferase [Aliisedimentitalea scapharcae]|uniref:Glycosyltransferase n=1 Tax=Aliisedimentitalea scapharcae TaxID=1524259 RepID=A0ABZ2XVN4_9RHOB